MRITRHRKRSLGGTGPDSRSHVRRARQPLRGGPVPSLDVCPAPNPSRLFERHQDRTPAASVNRPYFPGQQQKLWPVPPEVLERFDSEPAPNTRPRWDVISMMPYEPADWLSARNDCGRDLNISPQSPKLHPFVIGPAQTSYRAQSNRPRSQVPCPGDQFRTVPRRSIPSPSLTKKVNQDRTVYVETPMGC